MTDLPLRLSLLIPLLLLSTTTGAERYLSREATSIDASATPLILLIDQEAGIEAAIAPSQGGELSGLRVTHDGQPVETLYLARDYSPRRGWTGKAPLLWPATGRNFPPDLEARQRAGERFGQGAYELSGQRYQMPIHGFARDFAWKQVSVMADRHGAAAALSLTDSAQSREYYPFGFELEVSYLVRNGELQIAYVVSADERNKRTMPFSIGNHITFNCPLLAASKASEVRLTTPSSRELMKTDYGIPTGTSRRRSHAQGIMLGEFERLRAVSLTGYSSDPVIEYADPHGLTIRMSHAASHLPDSPIVLYNIWGDAEGGFFSPEPWVGLQNSLVLDQGLVRLEPGESFDWTITIEFVRRG